MEWRLWRQRGLEGSQQLMVEMAILALHGTGWQALSEMVGVKNSLWEVVKMGAFRIECPPERGDLHPRSIRFGLGHTQQSVWRKESWAGKVSPCMRAQGPCCLFLLMTIVSVECSRMYSRTNTCNHTCTYRGMHAHMGRHTYAHTHYIHGQM